MVFGSSKLRGLRIVPNSSKKYTVRLPEFQVDHFVIDSGVVGLAIARQLAFRHSEHTTYLVEWHNRAREETSSRFYYPTNSAKTRLCLKGRYLLYEHCDKYSIPHQKTGKLVVGHPHQLEYLHNLHNQARRLLFPFGYGAAVPDPSKIAAPSKLISGHEARSMEPDLSPDTSLALSSPETRVLDSHAFMEFLEKDIGESPWFIPCAWLGLTPTISSRDEWLRMASLMHCFLRAV